MSGTAILDGSDLPARFVSRRHAAVAFADIVGYTILMGAEPERTHARWMALLFAMLRPLARTHGSSIVKSTGDGVVADFPTVADAYAWAEAVQRGIRDTDSPDLPPIAFRIAISVGDIHATDDDVYGESVNVAARLQEHAPPGGIAMTEAARAALVAPPAMHDLGVLHLRNIVLPVRAFVLEPPSPARVPIRPPPAGIPSIAVMPFDNPGGDLGDAYFADGVIDDIVISLGALRELSVIARGATLGWTGGRHDPRVIGRVLGVRYVLTGSVRRGPGHLRLSVELRETEDGDSIWQDRFEAADHEVFAVQDEIVARAVGGIAPSVRAAELRRALRRRPDSLTAYDLTLRGMHALDGLRRESFRDAGQHFDRAMHEDPGYAMPAAWAAQWHSFAVGQAWSDTPEADAALVGEMAARAVQLDPGNALGFAMCGHYRAYHRRDPASALPFYDQAVQACPNHALAWSYRSGSLSYLGRGQEALASAQRAYRLSPHGPDRYYFQGFVSIAHYACGHHEDVVHWTRLVLADNPGFTSSHRILIPALDALGRYEEAREVAQRMMTYEPRFRLSVFAEMRAPFVDPALRAQQLGALRRAGVPD